MAKKMDSPEEISPPRPNEYLPGAIQKAVKDEGLKHPATIYPIAIGVSAGIVGWLFNMPYLFIVALVCILLGPIWAIFMMFFLGDKTGKKYIEGLNQRQRAYERHLKKQLEVGLRECQDIEGAGNYAIQGSEQLQGIDVKLKNVMDLLEMKLTPGEITFGRFLGAADQVSLSVLDNIKKIVSILKSVDSIEPEKIQKRLKWISEKETPSSEDGAQEKTLIKRLAIWEEQLQKVNRLLAKNEEAMTEMEKISAAIADWQTDGRFADTDFESAISRLQELAARAHEYM